MDELRSPASPPRRAQAILHLSGVVIAIEFTLISVMVGVILFPLMDSATPLLHDLDFEYWPYILCGLLYILELWAEVITHSLSFIGWPIDVGHNLLYIVLAMVLAIQMHFLADPRGWFALSWLSTLVILLSGLNDLHIIRQRNLASNGPATGALFRATLTRQIRFVRMGAGYLLLLLAAAGCFLAWPRFLLEQHGHLLLIGLQNLTVLAFLLSTLHEFVRWQEPILRKTVEELDR